VATVWSVSLDRVHEQAPAAEALLSLLAFPAPDVPRNLPSEQPQLLPEPLATVVADRLAYMPFRTGCGDRQCQVRAGDTSRPRCGTPATSAAARRGRAIG
jgi:hypothetical protein